MHSLLVHVPMKRAVIAEGKIIDAIRADSQCILSSMLITIIPAYNTMHERTINTGTNITDICKCDLTTTSCGLSSYIIMKL